MKLPSLKEKFLDLLLIEVDKISYFKIEITETKFNILKNEKISAPILSQNIINFNVLEEALTQIILKNQIQEVGIILHLPNILFQKINLIRSPNIQEALYNYLKTTFPLPLDEYSFYFKEDTFQKTGDFSSFNIYFINKELTSRLLIITEKFSLSPLFITFSAEALYHYLLEKTLINFDSEYLIFFINQNIILIFWIKNLRIEKVILEHISSDTNINLTILHFYNFLKVNLKKNTKILFFTEREINIPIEVKEEKFVFIINITDALLESGKILFKKVFSDEKFIDFLPIKPRLAYFLRRLPKIFNLLSIFIVSLILIFVPFYFYIDFKLKKQLREISSQTIQITQPKFENRINNFLKLTQTLDLKILEKFQLLNKVQKINSLEKVEFDKEKITFSLIVKKENVEKVKSSINKSFPEAKLLSEEDLGEKFRLNYEL